MHFHFCANSYNFATLKLDTLYFSYFVLRGSPPPPSTLDRAREMTTLPFINTQNYRHEESRESMDRTSASGDDADHCRPSPRRRLGRAARRARKRQRVCASPWPGSRGPAGRAKSRHDSERSSAVVSSK
jgi:hypothetical protein